MTETLSEESLNDAIVELRSVFNAPTTLLRFKPTKIVIQPYLVKIAFRILRAPLFMRNRRSNYLKRKGARK